jgi:predicted CXXCH cytochrome family protein
MKRFVSFMTLAAVAVFLGAASSYAYDETVPPTGRGCNDCHGLEAGETSPTVAPTRTGPHGGYTTGTSKCATCHTIHNATAGFMLLPALTIRDTCNSCHDGTGGKGVYGVLAARGLTPGATHSIEETNVIPGGALDGGNRAQTFSALNGTLTCSDCHSPHGSVTVAPFTGDRARESTPTTFVAPVAAKTDRLLRQKPTGADTAVPVYGSSWCGSCHKGRLSGSAGVVNHVVETETAGFSYDAVQVITAAGASTTATGTLGASNFGYVMPSPRTPGQDGHYPICQQCHEDSRNVGDETSGTVTAAEAFKVTAADGASQTDNPRFQVFPHESVNPGFLVETKDDLCLNCHPNPGG